MNVKETINFKLSRRELILLHACLIKGLKGFHKDELDAIEHDEFVAPSKFCFNETLQLYVRVSISLNEKSKSKHNLTDTRQRPRVSTKTKNV